jgi:hypothetical protein
MAASTFTDWLSAELDKKLATLPSDQARYRHLILIGNVWRLKYARWQTVGEQPFNEPHPIYGDMNAFDFAILLVDIDRRKHALEGMRVFA